MENKDYKPKHEHIPGVYPFLPQPPMAGFDGVRYIEQHPKKLVLEPDEETGCLKIVTYYN